MKYPKAWNLNLYDNWDHYCFSTSILFQHLPIHNKFISQGNGLRCPRTRHGLHISYFFQVHSFLFGKAFARKDLFGIFDIHLVGWLKDLLVRMLESDKIRRTQVSKRELTSLFRGLIIFLFLALSKSFESEFRNISQNSAIFFQWITVVLWAVCQLFCF